MLSANAPSMFEAGRAASGGLTPVHPARETDWDAMLARDGRASIFHSAAWADVLEKAYGYEPCYFVKRDGSGLQGLLPMMEVNSWLTGRRGVSLPFTDECGPICADEQGFKSLAQRVTAYGRSRGWKYVEFRGGRKWMGEAPASLGFYAHEVDLTGSEEQLFERVDASVRRAIRKAEREGVTVEVTDSPGAMREFYGLLCGTRKKHGMPPQPLKFFEKIHEQIVAKKLGAVALARFEGRAIAGGVYFCFGGRAVYKYGASDERFQHLRGNNLVMWEAMKWLAARGSKSLHLGRTSLGNAGLRRFKLNWGASEQGIEYVKYDLRQERFLTDKDESAGWHNRVFSRMPIFMSRLIGQGLYRHWA
jgi:hypothetical protein